MPVPSAKRRKTVPEGPKIIDAAKTSKGDIVIRAGPGDEAVLIRAHSTLLKMASPVFGAMLGPNFVEGSTQYTEENPLALEDDHPGAMLDLCALLHHQYTDPLPLTKFSHLVVVADKYQCVGVVKPWFVSAIMQYLPSSISETMPPFDKHGLTLPDAMCIAYAVEDSQLFCRISKIVVVTTSTKRIASVISDGLQDLMPDDFPDTIQSLQINERERLAAMLERVEADLLNNIIGEEPCNRLRYTIGKYNYQQWNYSLKRRDLGHEGTEALSDAYKHIGTVAEDCDPFESDAQNAECAKDCATCPTTQFKQDILQVVEVSKRECKGLCLECMRTKSTLQALAGCQHRFEK